MEFQPKCVPVPGIAPRQTAIRAIHWDGSNTLDVDIEGEDFAFSRLTFSSIVGFRVIDELHLTEFWKDYHEKAGWLWEVQSGGWMDLGNLRSTFCARDVIPELREFLIVDDMCISVMTATTPTVRELGTTPDA